MMIQIILLLQCNKDHKLLTEQWQPSFGFTPFIVKLLSNNLDTIINKVQNFRFAVEGICGLLEKKKKGERNRKKRDRVNYCVCAECVHSMQEEMKLDMKSKMII